MLMDAVARRYRVLPFDEEFLKVWQSPYRRAVLVSMIELDTEERIILKRLSVDLPEIMQKLIDVLGVNLINISGKSVKNPVKTMFKRKRRYKPNEGPEVTSYETGLSDLIKLPDGRIIKQVK